MCSSDLVKKMVELGKELVKKTVSLKKLNHPVKSESIMMMITVGPGRQMGVWEKWSKAYCDLARY